MLRKGYVVSRVALLTHFSQALVERRYHRVDVLSHLRIGTRLFQLIRKATSIGTQDDRHLSQIILSVHDF